jgi:hypothetical protein
VVFFNTALDALDGSSRNHTAFGIRGNSMAMIHNIRILLTQEVAIKVDECVALTSPNGEVRFLLTSRDGFLIAYQRH